MKAKKEEIDEKTRTGFPFVKQRIAFVDIGNTRCVNEKNRMSSDGKDTANDDDYLRFPILTNNEDKWNNIHENE